MNKWMKKILAIVISLALVFSLSNVPGLNVNAAVKKPTKITLKTNFSTVDINGKVQISVKSVSPSGASKAVTYKSSNKKIATVSTTGVVTGKKAGTVTITATSKVNTKIKSTIKIKVKDIRPTSVALNKKSYSGYIGNTTTLKATVKPKNSNQKVTYKSSNKNVATVSSTGKITLLSHGTATITATTSQKNAKGKKVTATCKVTVKDRAKSDLAWKYITADELFESIDSGKKITILDIRTKTIKDSSEGYTNGHIEGSLWVPAWPVDSTTKQNKLRTSQVEEVLKDDNSPIIIIGTSNTAAAKRAVSVLKGYEGIKLSRMYILKGGAKSLIANYSERLVQGVKSFSGEYVISASTLKKKMDAKETMKIVDTRGISNSKVTIKGAITMTWKQISKSTKTDGTKQGAAGFARTLEADEISTVLSGFGLRKTDQIILVSDGYSSGGWGDDGRILWQLLQCGYTNVKMVNGGISAMKTLCGDNWGKYSQTGPSTAKKKTVTIEQVDQELNSITTEDLLALYKSEADFKVVDVRTNAEYNGAVLYNEKSGGHLKDAIHIRFTDLFRTDGTLKDVSELTYIFEKAGLEKEDKIITYCTGGIRSAYMCLVLEMCGFENCLNYAESAYRWSNTKSAGTEEYWTK